VECSWGSRSWVSNTSIRSELDEAQYRRIIRSNDSYLFRISNNTFTFYGRLEDLRCTEGTSTVPLHSDVCICNITQFNNICRCSNSWTVRFGTIFRGFFTNLYRMCFSRTLQPVATSLRIVRFRSNIIERISDLLALIVQILPPLRVEIFVI
jgi:hypothetical protein